MGMDAADLITRTVRWVSTGQLRHHIVMDGSVRESGGQGERVRLVSQSLLTRDRPNSVPRIRSAATNQAPRSDGAIDVRFREDGHEVSEITTAEHP